MVFVSTSVKSSVLSGVFPREAGSRFHLGVEKKAIGDFHPEAPPLPAGFPLSHHRDLVGASTEDNRPQGSSMGFRRRERRKGKKTGSLYP